MPEQQSQELVPLRYSRVAWNVINNAETREHNGLLSAEQARQINSQYHIEICLGAHGQRPSAGDMLHVPTETEYAAVDTVLDTLQPGKDVLFVEGRGFKDLPPDRTERELGKTASANMMGLMSILLGEMVKEIEPTSLLADRQAGRINAWEYARREAALRGIRVVDADWDAFDDSLASNISGGRGEKELATSIDPADIDLKDRINRRRELKARNIVKDWALEHPVPPSESENDKPKLVLLFGSSHAAGLQDAFEEIHLNPTVTHMSHEGMAQKAADHFAKQPLSSGVLDRIAKSMPDSKGSAFKQVRSKRQDNS